MSFGRTRPPRYCTLLIYAIITQLSQPMNQHHWHHPTVMIHPQTSDHFRWREYSIVHISTSCLSTRVKAYTKSITESSGKECTLLCSGSDSSCDSTHYLYMHLMSPRWRNDAEHSHCNTMRPSSLHRTTCDTERWRSQRLHS